MLYAISKELDAALKAQGVPFRVVFGPESTQSVDAARERIVLEQPHDEKRDSVVPPIALHRNPMMPLVRNQAARIRIFARSPIAGAKWNDHAERAEQVLDHVLAELDAIVRGRKNALAIGGGGFVSLVDEKGSSVWGGAVYEFDFVVDRGVFRTNWKGEAREEVTIGTDVDLLPTTVKVSKELGPAGTPPGNAETASGG